VVPSATMPPGAPFHGLIPPFPIRVDAFGPTPGLTSVPALHLLSHTHSDHVLGLSAKSFASTIICSPDAKEMLLRHEVFSERALNDIDLRGEARLSKTFAHLKISPLLKDGRFDYSASKDLLVCHSHPPM
jgi:metal-dependent hydrolase (beta-lactamase superfamily II)